MIYHLSQPISLNTLQRIKKWHIAHKVEHRLEYQLLDMVFMF